LTGYRLSGNYAIIVDEAHDGETGKQHENMYKALLGVSFDNGEELLTEEQEISENAVSGLYSPTTESKESSTDKEREVLPALNFFAYTATPNAAALRVFGERKEDEHGNITYEPFHTYSMRQAREEGYINDVLANYVTHDRFVKINIDDVEYEGDKIVDFAAGRVEIGKWMQTLPEVKEVIVNIVIQKMRDIVIPSLNGHGKAMLSCSSRSEAVAYKHLLDHAVAKLPQNERFESLVAFSGTVYDPSSEEEVTELSPWLNNGLGKQQDIAKAFEDDKFRLMIVANKYQVGFDQPKLMCMFIDKSLNDINLIQTTARVNRKIAGKDNVYIFDFVNDREDVLDTFR
jgi:type I restriction enzyme R subunit